MSLAPFSTDVPGAASTDATTPATLETMRLSTAYSPSSVPVTVSNSSSPRSTGSPTETCIFSTLPEPLTAMAAFCSTVPRPMRELES